MAEIVVKCEIEMRPAPPPSLMNSGHRSKLKVVLALHTITTFVLLVISICSVITDLCKKVSHYKVYGKYIAVSYRIALCHAHSDAASDS